jgi:hypothetical protein
VSCPLTERCVISDTSRYGMADIGGASKLPEKRRIAELDGDTSTQIPDSSVGDDDNRRD